MPWCGLGAVEYEVGGQMYQVDSVTGCGFGKIHRSCDVEPDGCIGVGLGAVHVVVSCAVDDFRDSVSAYIFFHGISVSDVELLEVRVQPVGSALSLCKAAELATELSVSAGNQNVFHLS